LCITVPDGAKRFTCVLWSEYAHRSVQVAEYLDEAASFYLEHPDHREKLELADPDMFNFTRQLLEEEFNVRP